MASKSGARFDYYRNTDGSFTRREYDHVINYKDSSGNWQHIDTTLTRGSDGRWHEKANSVGVSFASASGVATGVSASASRTASATASARSASYVTSPLTSLPWQLSRSVDAGAVTSGSSTGSLATLQISSSESVSWSLSGANDVPASVSGSTSEYDGILTDTNLELTSTPVGVKESLVLTSASAPTSWVFPMQLTGLSLTTASDGTIELVDGSGTVVATLPKAYAYDAYVDPVSGEHHDNWSMSYSVTQVNGAPAIAMSLDPSWLSGSSIQFPVTVDPTMSLTTSGQTDTTYIEYPYSGDYSSDSVLKVGTYDGGAHIAASLIKFPTLPTDDGYHITGATFGVFDIWAATCGTSDSYHINPITSSWSVTGSKSWSNMPGTAAAIGTWSGTPSSTVCSNSSLSPSQGEWQHTSLSTSYFQDIALGETPNNGLAITASGTDSQDWKQFDSDHVSSYSPYVSITYSPNVAPDIEHVYPASGYSSPTLTPELQVQAVDPDKWPNSSLTYDFAVYNSSGSKLFESGYQSSPNWQVPAGKLAWSKNYYWTVTASDGWSPTTSPGQAFTTQVSQPLVASELAQNTGHGYDEGVGNYTTSATDVSVATVGPKLDVTRDYNSLDTRTSGVFGAGWSSIADMKAVMDDDGSKNVVITTEGGKQQRYGYSASGYTPPLGTYATLLALSGGGYTLTDTTGTTYTFGTAGGTNTWLLSKITTHAGLSESLTYNSSHELTQIENNVSQRSLYFAWTTPSGAAHPHVQTVTTDEAIANQTSSAVLWTYGYTGDELTSVCPPAETDSDTASTNCYQYSYTASSNYPAAALDADPHSYWRLDEASGATNAASSVLSNEQTDAGIYNSVTLGSTSGPFSAHGSTATAATFNGSSSYVKLPQSLVTGQTFLSVALWFKTSATGGLLFTEQNQAMGSSTTPSQATASLYVGTDGKLHGGFYNGTTTGLTSSSTVDNNAWHLAVIAAAGNTETLYLDGVAQGTASGVIQNLQQSYAYLGAGYSSAAWPSEPAAGYRYFNGSIADAGLYTHQLTASQVADLYSEGTSSAQLLTKAVLPSGNTQASVSYDTASERLLSVTDEKGGTYKLGSPTVAGSSAVYRSSVLGANPTGYWQLGDQAGSTDAADEVNGGLGTYTDTTLGVSGPFKSVDSTAPTAASFNGTDSDVALPHDLASATTGATAEVWFNTKTGGAPLLGMMSDQLSAGTSATSRAPVLWVGSNGLLYGRFWGSGTSQLASTATVTDGKWHHAVLTATATKQVLYLDGTQVASSTPTSLSLSSMPYLYLGAVTTGTGWDGLTGDTTLYFNGSMGEAALYLSALSSTQVANQWQAYKQSSGTVATETVKVTDPGNHTLSSTFDLSNGGRLVSSTDGTGATTSYGYDTGGFLNTVTDPNGNVTTTGHDARGNVASRTTCQDQAANKCSTSYYTYYLNTSSATDPRNDAMLTSSDGRSSSSADKTYQTSYTYDTNGNQLTDTTPPVPGHTSGLTTTKTYTTSTTAGWIPDTYAPAGLLDTSTTPGGAKTQYMYDTSGDLAGVVDARGLSTQYDYDALGRVADKWVGGQEYTYSYDGLGRVLTETDPGVTNHVTGVVHTKQTSYTYDADGDTLTTTVADTTGSDPSRKTVNTYTAHDQLATSTDPMGYQTQYGYDAYGNLTSKQMPRGQQYSYSYDADGRLLDTTLANYTGSTSTPQTAASQLLDNRAYDAGGRLLTDTNAIGVTRTWAYYDNGLTKQITDTGSQGTTYVEAQDSYDPAGNQTSKVTKNGTLTTQHVYDAADRVQTATVDPSGADRVTDYTYDADSHVLTLDETDKAGDPAQQWTYTYYTDGDKKTAAQYVDSSTTLTTQWTSYDQYGHPLTVEDPKQNTTSYAYDEIGRRYSTTLPTVTVTSPTDGSTSSVAPTTLNGYDTFGDRTQSQDARGDITATAYDANGRKTGTTLPSYTPHGSTTAIASTTAWTYDADNHVTKTVDGNGNETDYTYDQLGDQVSKTNPAINIGGTPTQGTWNYTYNLAGQKLTTTDPYGGVAHTTYDDLGRTNGNWQYIFLSSTATNSTKTQTTDTYNPAGEIASQASLTGVTATYGYDNLGQRTSVADTTGDTTKYTYDLRGDVTKTVLPDGSIQTTAYDAAGRKTATADENSSGTALRSTSASYDNDGNLTKTVNALQIPTSYGYNADNELISQTEQASSTHNITTGYGYDAAGDKTAYTDGNGQTTYYTYTPWDLPESKEIPAATTSTYSYTTAADRTTYTSYDADGRTTGTTLPGSVTLAYTYDALGDLTGQSGTGADATTQPRTFKYDLAQNLVYSAVGSTSEDYDHNSWGDVLDTYGQAGSSSFTYNQDNSLTARTDASGTSSYTYDTNGRLAADTDAATGTALNYAYNNLSQLTSVTYGTGGNVRSYGYDALHRLASDSLATPTGTTVAAVTYQYDNGDELTTKTTSGFTGAGTNSYQYDNAGRLTSWTDTPSGSTTGTTTGYTYDDDGNRLTAGTTSYTYDTRDQLTSDGKNSYTYTARGTLSGKTNTATNSTTAYTFDAYGQQITAGPTSYTYDALGRTITAGPTTFTYSGENNLVASDGTTTYSRDASGTVTGQNTTGTGSTLVWTDVHTDVVGQFTATGTTLTGSAAYDPWGTPLGTSTLKGSLGYQSEYTDPTTGQVNMHARWYVPGNGAFNSADTQQNPAVGASTSANPFAYTNDHPLTGTDPSGHCIEDACIGEGTLLVEGCIEFCGDIADGAATLAEDGWDSIFGDSSADSAADSVAADSSVDEAAMAQNEEDLASYEAQAEAENEAALESLSEEAASTDAAGSASTAADDNAAANAARAAEEQAARERAAAELRAEIRARAIRLTRSIGRAVLQHFLNHKHTQSDPATQLDINAALQEIRQGSSKTFDMAGVSTNSDDSTGCGEGSIEYGPRDASVGKRATGVEACLTKSMIGTGSPAQQKGVPGYRWAQQYATELGVKNKRYSVNACHLLGDQLGGDGVLANLAACGRSTNASRQDPTDIGRNGPMTSFEGLVREELEAGQDVHYRVVPEYEGNRTVPYAFVMEGVSTTGEMQVSVVPNVIYSPTSESWVNIGTTSCTTCGSQTPTPGVK